NPTTGNNKNNAVGLVAVPDVVNVFYTLREPDLCMTRPVPADVRSAWEALARRSSIETEELACGLPYVRAPRMSRDLPAPLYHAVRERDVQGLVLDLRGNPGGELDAAIELADDFLPRGALVVTFVDPSGDRTERRARRGARYAIPLTILVDGLTASAAEIFA